MTRMWRRARPARCLAWLLCCALALETGGTALAEAPAGSPRPLIRPGAAPASVSAAPLAKDATRAAEVQRPMARKPAAAASEAAPTEDAEAEAAIAGVKDGVILRPRARADAALTAEKQAALMPEAASAQPREAKRQRDRGGKGRKSGSGYSAAGSVCGVNAIKGSPQKTFGNPGSGCGVKDPVQVTSVAGVRLSEPATLDCPTARALNGWVEGAIKPAFGSKAGGVVELKVAAHYVCRNRNRAKSGKLSEHAKGHAIDIAAFRLGDGTEVSVLESWRAGKWSKAVRSVHSAACGTFGTVLGPNSDSFHKDHIHVDTQPYSVRPYCK